MKLSCPVVLAESGNNISIIGLYFRWDLVVGLHNCGYNFEVIAYHDVETSLQHDLYTSYHAVGRIMEKL